MRQQLFPYAIRLRAGETSEAYFKAAVRLREEADQRTREMPKDDVGGSAYGDDD